MMSSEENLQLCFKEFIKVDLYPKGIDRIEKTPALTQQSGSDYVCDLFVHEPQNTEEAHLGTLFMLGKIENIPKNKYRNFDFLLSLLISVIKREFYVDSKRPTSEALEASLNKANLYLADFTEKGNVEWIGNLNFICGAFSQNTLHIAQTGESIIKLFRETGISHIENKFPTQKKAHPLKTFGNIASGMMLNNDKIILGSKNILNITSLTSLKELSRENCHKIIENLKILAERKVNEHPIICLALETTTEAPEKIVPTLQSVSQPSAQSQNIKVKRARIKAFTLRTLRIMRRLSIIIFLAIYKTISFLVSISKKMFRLLASLFRKISKTRLLRRIGTKVKPDFRKLTRPLLPVSATLHSWLSTKWGKTKNNYYLLKQNKPVFFVVSLMTILILILPFVAAQKINYYIKIDRFNELSTEIEEVQKRASAALIYSEKEKARGLLQKNQNLLANLLIYLEKTPLKNNSRVLNRAVILQSKHQEQQDSINNVKRIEKLKDVLDFSKSGFIVNPIGITKIKDNLYFFELESGILYKYDLSANSLTNEPSTNGSDLILVFISAKDELRKMVSLENGQIVLFGQSGKIYLYNSNTNDHSAYLIDPIIPVEKIKDVKNFFSIFYILNVEQGNIAKYSLSQIKQGVIKGSNWLSKSVEELKNAQSMAIDGSIYILSSDGLITRYYRGEKAEDIKPLLEKPLGKDSKIFIEFDFDNFYISDPKNKRLIVLNKQGEIINQYVNDEFANLKDFWVTDDEKEVYLLCKKKVYILKL